MPGKTGDEHLEANAAGRFNFGYSIANWRLDSWLFRKHFFKKDKRLTRKDQSSGRAR
jgi:hypothetical protein